MLPGRDGPQMQNFVVACIAVLVLAAGVMIFNAGLDPSALPTMFMSLSLVQQITVGVVTLAAVLVIGAALVQSDRLARQRRAIAALSGRLDGVRQSTRAAGEAQAGVDAVLERAVASDPEEALATIARKLAEAERATALQHNHNEAVDLESRADDIRRRQQALRARLGEVFDKRRLVEPIFGELQERQSIIARSLQDFEKGEGEKSLETHLAELTEFVRRSEDRFQAFDQGLLKLDRIKADIARLEGRIAPLESADTGIKRAIQDVSGLRDRLAGALDRLEQDGERTVSERVHDLAEKTREFEQRVASLCDHFVMLDAVRTDIGILFTRLNVALATHSAVPGPKGPSP
jgi:chromosome segregation ATPase